MANEHIVKTHVTDTIKLVIDPEDGTAPKEWKLCYDYRAIAKIEETIGKDLKKITDWKDLSSGKDFPVIVWGGLSRFNPDVTLDQVLDVLNPEAQRLLSDQIFDLMFPQVREALEKLEREQGASNSPNVEAATTNQ